MGDNNYDTGSAATIANNVGKYYSWAMTSDPSTNRFWPLPGNHVSRPAGCHADSRCLRPRPRRVRAVVSHPAAWRPFPCTQDWGNACSNPTGLNPYLAYFAALGNKRYYARQVGGWFPGVTPRAIMHECWRARSRARLRACMSSAR